MCNRFLNFSLHLSFIKFMKIRLINISVGDVESCQVRDERCCEVFVRGEIIRHTARGALFFLKAPTRAAQGGKKKQGLVVIDT